MKKIKTFVISLRDAPIRTEYIIEQCKLNNIEAELFDAVDGYKLGLIPEYTNKLEFPDLDLKMSKGCVGCALSHYILWNIIKYLPYEEFLILEDDCIFGDNFSQKFDELYNKLPVDWEMAYVGWIAYGKDIDPLPVADGISIRIPSATHAYLVKKSVLSKLINSVHPLSSPIDLLIIAKVLPLIKYYVFDPPIVNQKSYMNFKDFDWLSSIYNWELDIYGLRRKLAREIKFVEGWYGLETDDNCWWRWSTQQFKILIPNIRGLHLKFSSAEENKLILTRNDKVVNEISIVVGDNDVVIDNSEEVGASLWSGSLKSSFVPARSNSNSTDTRELGIRIMKVEVEINQTLKIPIDIQRISI